MEIVRFECPKCSQTIETDEPTARKGVRCPGCGTEFVPEEYKPEEYKPEQSTIQTSSKPAEISQREKIKQQAKAFIVFAILLAIFGVVVLVVNLLDAFTKLESISGTSLELTAAAFALSLWFFLLGQIIHIRANTEK